MKGLATLDSPAAPEPVPCTEREVSAPRDAQKELKRDTRISIHDWDWDWDRGWDDRIDIDMGVVG